MRKTRIVQKLIGAKNLFLARELEWAEKTCGGQKTNPQ
jgi:hypothetical protein